MMIESLVNGKESSSFVVIKDTLAAPGENLLVCWTRQLRERGDVVVRLHCGTGMYHGYDSFAIDCLQDLQCHGTPSPLSSVLAKIQSHPGFPASGDTSSHPTSSIVFILPDMNSLFLFFPSSAVFRFIDSLLRLFSSSSSSSIVGLL